MPVSASKDRIGVVAKWVTLPKWVTILVPNMSNNSQTWILQYI